MPIHVAVKVVWRSRVVARGYLVNVSISGALAATDDRPPLWSRVEVELETARRAGAPPAVPAYVVRHSRDGVGLEWCEFAPEAVVQWLGAPMPAAQALAAAPELQLMG